MKIGLKEENIEIDYFDNLLVIKNDQFLIINLSFLLGLTIRDFNKI